ncbi:MAG: NAD(P)-dependent oxidoreductase [Gammaproteobacteria bacterium]
MKIFLIGGTGAVGRHAVDSLLGAGHELTVLARSPDVARALENRGVSTSDVSIFDRTALADAFTGMDAVVNLASAIPPMSRFMVTSAWDANTRVRTEGSAAISAAASDAGVSRLVQESVSMIYPDSGDAWVDENKPVDRFPIAEANLAAEANAARFSESGGTGIVLRFGWFYGPGATHSEQFLALARRHLCVQMGRPDTYVSSIFMPDAGAAVAAILDAPAGVYNVTDDEPLTKREYADALADAVSIGWRVRVPGAAALLFGNKSTSLTRSIRATNRKIRATTHWQPQFRSAREGWLELARLKGD